MSATRIVVTVDQTAVREYVTSPSGPVYRFVEEKAKAVQQSAKRYCPSASGALRNSIDIQMLISAMTVYALVGSRLGYAIYVHEGTGIYGPRHAMIFPVKGKFLVFTPSGGSAGSWGQAGSGSGGAGGTVFARSVKGIPSTPFLYQAMLAELPGWPVTRIPVSG
jgi:hypothetical protein